MVFRMAAFLSVGWYGLLFFWGFYYLALDQELYEEFFRVGWENYEGLSLSYPENAYYSKWLYSTLVSFFILRFLPLEQSLFKTKLIIVNLLFCLSYLGLYFVDGDISIKEGKVWWIITSICQVVGHSMLIAEEMLKEHSQRFLKFIYSFQALLYLGFIGLGLYYWQWDLELVEEKENLGWQHHDKVMVPAGRAVKVPELNYHTILMVGAVLSLAMNALVGPSNKWLSRLNVLLLLFTLYSGVVYFNGYSFTMQETMGWWISGCGWVAAIFAILAWQTKPATPDLEPLYEDNLLDDFSSLEED